MTNVGFKSDTLVQSVDVYSEVGRGELTELA